MTTTPPTDGQPGVSAVLAQQVAKLRHDRGLSQAQLAAQVGLLRSAISEIENGHRAVSVAEWIEIADTLSVDPMALLRPPIPKVITLDTGGQLAALSRWIDASNAHRDPEAVTWGRLAKLQEEAGEVVSAFIGATGQNPRKGVTHTRDDVEKEALDVAVTALGVVEHLIGNDGSSLHRLGEFVERLIARAGLDQRVA